MKFKEALKGYEISKKASPMSESTITLYQFQLRHLENFLEPDAKLSDIDKKTVDRFMYYMKTNYVPNRKNGEKSPLSGSSLRILHLALRSFFKWAEDELDIPRPDLHLKRPIPETPETIPFTHEEIGRLLDATRYKRESKGPEGKVYKASRNTSSRDKALIMLLVDTGLRASEVCRLNIEDYVMDSHEIRVKPFGTGRKTKARTCYLGVKANKAMWRYLAKREGKSPEQPLFAGFEGKRMKPNGIRHLLVRLGEKSGVANVTTHRFRHTFAIEYLRNEGDVFTLQRMLGHSTLKMVQHYLAIAKQDVATAHRRSSPVDKLQF